MLAIDSTYCFHHQSITGKIWFPDRLMQCKSLGKVHHWHAAPRALLLDHSATNAYAAGLLTMSMHWLNIENGQRIAFRVKVALESCFKKKKFDIFVTWELDPKNDMKADCNISYVSMTINHKKHFVTFWKQIGVLKWFILSSLGWKLKSCLIAGCNCKQTLQKCRIFEKRFRKHWF